MSILDLFLKWILLSSCLESAGNLEVEGCKNCKVSSVGMSAGVGCSPKHRIGV